MSCQQADRSHSAYVLHAIYAVYLGLARLRITACNLVLPPDTSYPHEAAEVTVDLPMQVVVPKQSVTAAKEALSGSGTLAHVFLIIEGLTTKHQSYFQVVS